MIPTKVATKISKISISAFYGLDRKIKAKSGEFSDMMNLGHGEYPCLLSIPEKVACSTDSSWTSFISNGYKIEKLMFPVYGTVDTTKFSGIASKTVGTTTTYSIWIDGEKKMDNISSYSDAVDYNGAILTVPNLLGYNYYMNTRTADNRIVRKIGYTVSLQLLKITSDGIKINKIKIENQSYPTKLLEEGMIIALGGFTGDFEDNNTIYPDNSLDYRNLDSPTSIIITNIASGVQSGYKILTIEALNAKGDRIFLETGKDEGVYSNLISNITISAYSPDADYGTTYQNKLWLCGHSGESIFASSVGKPLEFYESTLSSGGSWTADVGSPGEFTGILALSNKLLVFKKEYLHIIYGDTPKTYSTEKTYTTGCIDRRSVARVGSYVIWLYHDGFYALSNGAPTKISESLNTNYESAIAFSDHKRYFARCKVKGENRYEFLVYDTEYGTWTKLTDSAIIGGCTYNGEPYVYTDSAVYKLFGGSYGDFYAETNELTFDSFMDKSAIDIYVRCRISSEGMAQNETAFLNVNTYVNRECFKHKAITTSGKHRLPIRCHPGDTLKLRFEGRGKVIIEDVEIKLEILENE